MTYPKKTTGGLLFLDVRAMIEPPQDDRERHLLTLLRALAKKVPVTLLTFTADGDRKETLLHGRNLHQERLPGGENLRRARDIAHLAGLGGAPDLASLLAFAEHDAAFSKRARELAAEAECVVHLTCLTGPILANENIREVFISGGLAADMVTSELHEGPAAKTFLKVLRLEQTLCRRAHAIFASCEVTNAYRILHGISSDRFHPTPLSEGGVRNVEAFLAAVYGQCLPSALPEPVILALNDYDVTPAMSGGMSRIVNLLGALEQPTLVLCLGERPSVTLMSPSLLVVVAPKTAEHRALEARIDHDQAVSTGDIISGLMAPRNTVLDALLSAFAPRAALCILEHPYMAGLIGPVRARNPHVRVVYSAHNVEAVHRPLMLSEHKAGAMLAPVVAMLERVAIDQADLIVGCTPEDIDILRKTGSNALVVLNGCGTVADGPKEVPIENHRVGFIGSSHRPNVEAALYIANEIAPAFPEVTFEFIGGVGGDIPSDIPNIVVHGLVDESGKSAIMHGWSVALNPVRSGGGSSLKLPDFLAHGLPVISTPEGARGFEVRLRGASVIASREAFAQALAALLPDVQARKDLARRSLAYAADSLRWKMLAGPYRRAIASLLVTPAVQRSQSLLVITTGYGEPGAVGNDPLLDDVAEALRARFTRIDLASADRTGRPPLSFTGPATDPAQTALRRLGVPFDDLLFFPTDDTTDPADADAAERGARALWMAEGVAAAERLTAHQPATEQTLRLLGGLYAREWDGTRHFHWSSGLFSFLLPRRILTLKLIGHNAESKPIAVRIRAVDSDQWFETTIFNNGNFSVSLALPPAFWEKPTICEFAMTVHEARPDLRLFGIILFQVIASCLPDAGADEHAVTELVETEIDLTDPLAPFVTHALVWPEIEAAPSPELLSTLAAPSPTLLTYISDAAARYDMILICRSATALAGIDVAPLEAKGANVIEYMGDYRRDPLLASMAGLVAAPTTRAIIVGQKTMGSGNETLWIPKRRYMFPINSATANDGPPYILIPLVNPDGRLIAFVKEIAATYRDAHLPGEIVVSGILDDETRLTLGLRVENSDLASLAGASAVILLDPQLDVEHLAVGAWCWDRPVVGHRDLAGIASLLTDQSDLLFSTAEEVVSILRRLGDERRCFTSQLAAYGWSEVANGIAAFAAPSNNQLRPTASNAPAATSAQ
jgi:glycosyltransferase involved in cell wall biosynthesis